MSEVASSESTVMSADWRNNLPEKVRGWDEVKNSDTAEKFFDQIANQRSLMGQSIRVPGEDAGEESMSAFYEKLRSKVPGLMRSPDPDDADAVNHVLEALGKPVDVDGYRLDDSANVTAEQLAELRGIAQEAGLTKAQFKSVAGKILNTNKESNEATEAHYKDQTDALRSEWGAAYNERLGLAKDIAERTEAPESLLKAIEEGKADAATVKWVYQLSKQLGGESATSGVPVETTRGKATLTPAEANNVIDDVMNNSKHPYWINSHPNHDSAVQTMVGLRRLVDAGG